MRKLAISALLVILSQFIAIGQTDQIFTSKISPKKVFIGKDTLLIVNFLKAIKSEFYNAEIQASYLLRKKNTKIDTLLSEIPENPDFEIPKEFTSPLKFNLDAVVYEFLNGQKEYDEDDARYQYSSSITIDHLKQGIFEVTYANAEYTGGSHGYGEETHKYYDLYAKDFFGFDDIFQEGAKKVIYDQFMEEMGVDKGETDPKDFPNSFKLTDNSIDFACGMYGSLFGFGGNYLGCSLSVPYIKLKKFVVENSPVERLIK